MANPFKPNDIVKTNSRVGGVVKFVACQLATIAGGRTCDKKHCNHQPKSKVWVKWPNVATLMTYDYTELAHDNTIAATPTQVIEAATDTKTETKDEYMDKAKEAITEVIKEQNKPIDDFFKAYNGFTTVRYDRSGRAYVRDDEHKQKPPIETKDVNWEDYNNFGPYRNRGPARKVGL